MDFLKNDIRHDWRFKNQFSVFVVLYPLLQFRAGRRIDQLLGTDFQTVTESF